MYSQITDTTKQYITEKFEESILQNKQAEQYSMKASVDINRQVQLIAEKDEDAFDVLLLNYHNNTQSLQGYKYLYLSCLTEAPESLDTPLIGQQWNRIDYIYYADELAKLHRQSFAPFSNIEQIGVQLPKLYRLVRASDAEAITFFTIEGHDNPIGLIILFYKGPKVYDKLYAGRILPHIQKLALLLDYEKVQK